MVNLDHTQQTIDSIVANRPHEYARLNTLQEAFNELLWFRENFDEMLKMEDKAEIADHVVMMLGNMP